MIPVYMVIFILCVINSSQRVDLILNLGHLWVQQKIMISSGLMIFLLMQAEAYIQLGQQDKALPLINQIRARAAASTGRLKKQDGTFPSKYNVKEYTNTGWTKDYALKALQWERRLEFATEGERFFDLVRWGIAEPTLNAYINVEKTRRPFLATAKFTAGRDEYLPIPQSEITFTKGLYKKNPGY